MSEESLRYGIDPIFFEDAIVQPSGIDWECAIRPELLEYLGFFRGFAHSFLVGLA